MAAKRKSSSGSVREQAESAIAVLAGTARIFHETVSCNTPEDLHRVCLKVAEEVTQSKVGFLGEINPQTGKLDDQVVSDSGMKACGLPAAAGHGRTLPAGLEVHGIYGRVLRDGKGLYSNDPPTHPDSIGTPPGHPPLTAFLGVPLVHAGATFGMVGLANRAGGYGPEQLQAAEALALVIAKAITSRRAEEALRDAAQQWQVTFDAVGDAVFLLDAEQRIRRSNKAAETLFGKSAAEMEGRLCCEIVHGTAAPPPECCVRRLRDSLHRESRELAMGDRCFNVTIDPVTDATGNLRGVVHIVSDIGERKRMEEALRESEAKFRAAFENAPFEFWVRDQEGRCIMQNAASVKHWGRRIGKRAAEGDFPPDVVALWEANNRRAFAGETVTGEVQYASAGEQRVYHNVVAPFRVDGEVRGILGFNFDITDLKRAENALQQAKETLEQRVRERTEAILMLHDVACMANQAQDPKQAIEYCLDRLTGYDGWSFGHALLPAADDADVLVSAHVCYPEDPARFARFREATLGMRFRRDEGLPGRVFASGKAAWITDLRNDFGAAFRVPIAEELGIRTAVAFPMLVGDKVVGVMEFFSDKVRELDERTIDAMTGVGMQLGRVIERAGFEEHLLAIPEEVQRAIAQDLHDDVGQELTGLGLKVKTLAEMLSAAETGSVSGTMYPWSWPPAKLAADIAADMDRTRSKVRGLSHRLLPVELEEGLLAVALGQLVAAVSTASRIACTFTCAHPDPVFGSRVATHLYRIAQEAVSNALRHGAAQNIRITLEQEDGETVLSIEDDGKGLPAEASPAEGMGLRTMRYRAGLIGGKLEVGPTDHGYMVPRDKGDITHLPERPGGCFAQIGSVPFVPGGGMLVACRLPSHPTPR